MKPGYDDNEKSAKIAVLKHIQKVLGKAMAGKLKPAAVEVHEISPASHGDAVGDEGMVDSKMHALQGDEPIQHEEIMAEGSPSEEASESPSDEMAEQHSGMHDADDDKVQAMLARRFGKRKK